MTFLKHLTKSRTHQSLQLPTQPRVMDNDVRRVVSVLLKKEVLALKPGRAHSHFAGISSDPMVNINMKEMLAWIAKKQKQTTKFNEAIGEATLSNSEASDDEDV